MKIIVIRENFREALGVVEGASGENQNLPILKNIFLNVSDNTIKLTSTNLEIAITSTISGKIIEQGKSTAPLGLLKNIIGAIQTERLNIEKTKNNLEIKTDNYQAIIQGADPNEFPIVPKIKTGDEAAQKHIEIDGGVLKEALSQVVVSSQPSNIRPELSVVFFDFYIDGIKVVATDSFRLAEKTISQNQFKTNHKDTFKLLIPLKTAHEALKIAKTGELIRIYHDENQILFKTEKTEFISRLTEGSFPDYQAVVPQKFDSEIIVDRQEFFDAVKLTGIFGTRINEVKVKVSENKKNIELFSADQATGENHYFLPAKTTGKISEIGFNWRHLQDGLRSIKTEKVFFGVNEADNKPALLKSSTDPFYLYVLMPILKT